MNDAEIQMRADDDSARDFAQDLIARIKMENRGEDINLSQALWVHSRLRALECIVQQSHADAFPPLTPLVGKTIYLDLMNLVISGDLETAYAALFVATPDDGSEDYHWLTSDRIAWIRHEIGLFLGWES